MFENMWGGGILCVANVKYFQVKVVENPFSITKDGEFVLAGFLL